MKPREWLQVHKYFVMLFFLALLIRLFMLLLLDPLVENDTPGYMHLAERMKSLDFSDFSGERAPGYPFIIWLANLNFKVVLIFQLFMGLSITVLLYKIIAILLQNKILAFLSGLFYTTFIPFLYFESLMYTETTATFYLVLSFYFLVNFLTNSKGNGSLSLIGLSIFASLTALTRSQFIFLPFLYLMIILICVIREPMYRFRVIQVFLTVCIPIVFFLGGWGYFMFRTTGYYTLTTLAGSSLMNKLGLYINDADEKYETLKVIYAKHQEAHIANTGSHDCAIFRAKDEMMEVTGLSIADLNMEIEKVAKSILKKHTWEYIKSIIPAWIKFWRPPGINEKYELPTVVMILTYSGRMIYLLIEILFLSIPIFFLIRKGMLSNKLKHLPLNYYFITVYLTIISSSIIQAMFENGRSRFSVPTDPLLAGLVFTFFLSGRYFVKRKQAAA
jgi:hypothetical protein